MAKHLLLFLCQGKDKDKYRFLESMSNTVSVQVTHAECMEAKN